MYSNIVLHKIIGIPMGLSTACTKANGLARKATRPGDLLAWRAWTRMAIRMALVRTAMFRLLLVSRSSGGLARPSWEGAQSPAAQPPVIRLKWPERPVLQLDVQDLTWWMRAFNPSLADMTQMHETLLTPHLGRELVLCKNAWMQLRVYLKKLIERF